MLRSCEGRYRLQIPQTHLVPPMFHPRQKQQLLLESWSQHQQIHDLRHPRPRHISQPGPLRIVLHRPGLNQPVEVDRQCRVAAAAPEQPFEQGTEFITDRGASAIRILYQLCLDPLEHILINNRVRPWMDPAQLGSMFSFSSTLMAPSRIRLDFSQLHGAVSL